MTDNDNRLLKDIHNDQENRIEDAIRILTDTLFNNESGYIKFASGILFCWDTVEGITSESGLISKLYPTQEFISIPLTFTTSVYTGGGTRLAKFITESPLPTSYRAYVLLENRVVDDRPVKVNYIAIGRWKQNSL